MELHELHGKFLNGALPMERIRYFVKNLRNGRSYCSRRVDAMQGSVLVFQASFSFQVPEPEQPQYFAPPPLIVSSGDFQLLPTVPDGQSSVPRKVLYPELCPIGHERYKHALATLPKEHRHYSLLQQWTHDQSTLAVEYRPAVPTMYDRNGTIQHGSTMAYWLRSRGPYPGSVNHQRAALGFHVDQFMLNSMEASTNGLLKDARFEVKGKTPSMQTSLDHTMWFHNTFQISDWLLMVVENQAVSNGRALILARIYRKDGVLVAIAVRSQAMYAHADPRGRVSLSRRHVQPPVVYLWRFQPCHSFQCWSTSQHMPSFLYVSVVHRLMQNGYLLPNVPVVLPHELVESWPAFVRWTRNDLVNWDALRADYGDHVAPVVVGSERIEMRVDSAIDLILKKGDSVYIKDWHLVRSARTDSLSSCDLSSAELCRRMPYTTPALFADDCA